MVWGVVVLWVVVVISWSAVFHFASSSTPLHSLHPLLGRAGQDRLSKHRHLGPQGTQVVGQAVLPGEMAFFGYVAKIGSVTTTQKCNEFLGLLGQFGLNTVSTLAFRAF